MKREQMYEELTKLLTLYGNLILTIDKSIYEEQFEEDSNNYLNKVSEKITFILNEIYGNDLSDNIWKD